MSKPTICISAFAGLLISFLLVVHIIKSLVEFTLKLIGAY
jgi:type III secretory pathway component EscS